MITAIGMYILYIVALYVVANITFDFSEKFSDKTNGIIYGTIMLSLAVSLNLIVIGMILSMGFVINTIFAIIADIFITIFCIKEFVIAVKES